MTPAPTLTHAPVREQASTTLYFTQTMTQYAAYSELITATATTIPTVTAVSTATAYAACATDYVLGPRTQDDQENLAYLIMNGAVASLDQVNVTTPLDCCNAVSSVSSRPGPSPLTRTPDASSAGARTRVRAAPGWCAMPRSATTSTP